jgi:hypothetical protein
VPFHDQSPPTRQQLDGARVHGGVAGFSLPEDEGRTLEAALHAERRGESRVRYEVRLSIPESAASAVVFYDFESPFPLETPERADAALLVALFPALRHGGTLRVKGVLSPLLVRNLLDLQAVWVRARPDRYRPFRLECEGQSDAVPPRASPRAVLPFTGGLDSTLALARHTDPSRPLGGATVDVGACLFLPGFAPRKHRSAEYAAATQQVRETAALRGMPLVVAETNFSEVIRWGVDAHGALLTTALTLLAPHFRMGLVGGSVPHSYPVFPVWGSAPHLDPFHSSDGFEIRNDGGDMVRVLKCAAIGRYPDLLERLVVCFRVPGLVGNCCRCEKCTRTMVEFLAAGLEIPKAAFPEGLDLRLVGKHLRQGMAYALQSLDAARENGVRHPALGRLRRACRLQRVKYAGRWALTRALPWVDLIGRRGWPPVWLLRRYARADRRRPRGLPWNEPEGR